MGRLCCFSQRITWSAPWTLNWDPHWSFARTSTPSKMHKRVTFLLLVNVKKSKDLLTSAETMRKCCSSLNCLFLNTVTKESRARWVELTAVCFFFLRPLPTIFPGFSFPLPKDSKSTCSQMILQFYLSCSGSFLLIVSRLQVSAVHI